MDVHRRRDRLVYFRISEDEFAEMLQACQSKELRSISDLARTALKEFIRTPGPDDETSMKHSIEALKTMVDELKESVQMLLLTSKPPAAPSQAHDEENNETGALAGTKK